MARDAAGGQPDAVFYRDNDLNWAAVMLPVSCPTHGGLPQWRNGFGSLLITRKISKKKQLCRCFFNPSAPGIVCLFVPIEIAFTM